MGGMCPVVSLIAGENDGFSGESQEEIVGQFGFGEADRKGGIFWGIGAGGPGGGGAPGSEIARARACSIKRPRACNVA